MKCPLISVIVPIYNEEKNVSRCIDSLLKQNYTSFEILLIDDGSQDNSRAIIDEYASKYSNVRALHKQNGGVSSARNLGLKEARGEWVTFCDADDYVMPDWLRLFALHINEMIGLVVQPLSWEEELVCNRPDKDEKIFEGDVYAFLENYYDTPMLGSTCNKLFSLVLIRKYGLSFNEFFRLCEDDDFFVHYLNLMEKDAIIVYTRYGGYKYSSPDFRVKYKQVENYFDTLLSIYRQIKAIHLGGSIPLAYAHAQKFLTHGLWDLFLKNNKNAWKSLNVYHLEIGNSAMKINGFPWVFRTILCFPPIMSFPCLKIMGWLMGKANLD